MANVCLNKVTVYGKKEVLDIIQGIIDSNNTLLSYYVPIPKEYKESLDKCCEEINSDSKQIEIQRNIDYWMIDNWGSVSDENIACLNRIDEKKLEFHSDTRHCPPIDGYVNISEKIPNVLFILNYYEPLMGYAGYFEIMKGKVINYEQYEDSIALESMAKYIYEEFIDENNSGDEYYLDKIEELEGNNE